MSAKTQCFEKIERNALGQCNLLKLITYRGSSSDFADREIALKFVVKAAGI